MTDSGHYIHGTEPEEQKRLARLNDLLNAASADALALEPGQRVLDVGSGLGQLSRELARRVGPEGQVVAIERDGEQLDEALRLAREAGDEDLVEFRLGEATDLPLADGEWGSFDVAHARFLLEHVPRPGAVVAAMTRAVKPGGKVVLEDDDHDLLRLWPEIPGFHRLWEAYLGTYDGHGNDPYVGRRLVQLLREAGAGTVKNDMLFFGACAGDDAFAAYVANFRGLIEGARDQILARNRLEQRDLDSGLAALDEWARRPDSALWYVTCWAEGRRGDDLAGAGDPELDPAADSSVRPRLVRPRSKVSSMDVLTESALDLNSSLHLDDVFAKIAERVQRLIDCHLFCVMLWNESTGLLEHSYSLRFGEHVEQEGGFPLGYGISGTAAKERRPLRVPDVREDPHYVRFRHAEVEIRSELAVPLVVKDRLIGAIDLESQELDAFSEEHERIMTALASQIATALDNARLYEELRAKEERLEDDLATAREIQRGLLPRRPPEVEGLEIGAAFLPARELSGDFYDFLRYPDGRVAIALGDVAGKATGAALYGSLAVGLLRGHAFEDFTDLADFLARLNRELRSLEIGRRFVAMLCALWEPGERRLSFAAAGVPQPYRVHNGRVETVEVRGLPVGGLDDSTYEVVEVALVPGDVVLLCSDGLEDCVDKNGTRFGDGALEAKLRALAAAPAQAIADGLLEESERFAGDSEASSDDRTVVVLQALP